MARAYYTATDLEQSFAQAEELAQHILGVTGFFEWESEPEAFEAHA